MTSSTPVFLLLRRGLARENELHDLADEPFPVRARLVGRYQYQRVLVDVAPAIGEPSKYH